MLEGAMAFADMAAWRTAEGEREAGNTSVTGGRLPGVCAACGAEHGFEVAPGGNLRESLACRACGCNARQRAAAALLLDAVAGAARPSIYLSEQASRLRLALRRFPGLIGSEFTTSPWRRLRLAAWLWRHGVFERLRHEDVTALSFADAGFDAIASLDVLEHVPDHRAALREFVRVLKPGGSLVLTVPFHADRAESRTLARQRPDGSIEHLAQPPEYHGDPLGHGVLCYHHFGWDLLDDLRTAGFAVAEAVRLHAPAYGWPQPLWLLRALR